MFKLTILNISIALSCIITTIESEDFLKSNTSLDETVLKALIECQQENNKDQIRSTKGKRGPRGPPGVRGPPGPSASRDPEEFLAARGEPGLPGIRGSPGLTGSKGETGYKGENGDKGMKGDTAQVGEAGGIGPPGTDGEAGRKGIPGDKGFSRRYMTEYAPLGLRGPKGQKGDKSDSSKQYVAFIPILQRVEDTPSHEELIILQKPIRNGTRLFPGKTCDDLIDQPSFSSGKYWIDPNGESVDDAIEVYCNKLNKETCIFVIQNQTGTLRIPSFTDGSEIDATHVWLSEMDGGIKIKYNASNSQIKYLQYLLPNAVQSVEFQCRTTEDSRFKDYDMSLQFLGWNDAILTAKGSTRSLQYTIVLNTCTKSVTMLDESDLRVDRSGTIKILYDTNKSNRLPVVDLALRNFEATTLFTIKINPVCFRKYNNYDYWA